jgi:ParB/RepB/Spo0J family partition protein
MAKSNKKNTDVEALEAPATHQVENIPVKLIYPSDSNPRKTFDDDGLTDLAKSMHDVGLIQPITIRPDGSGKYEIVAGERRFKAAQRLHWPTIPAMVRDIGDEEILEIQVIENLQREDVSPIEEAAAFKSILQRESFDWLCSRIHKSKKYITDRLKLNDLVEEARDYVHKGILPITHALMITKLPEEEQAKCIKKCIEEDWDIDREVCKLTTHQLRAFIEDELMIDLEKACFDLQDAELLPAAGSCATCPKRTCNQNLLFQEITEDDKCTDASCFHEKEKAHVDQALKKAKEEFDKGQVLAGEKHPWDNGLVKVKGLWLNYKDKPGKGNKDVCVVITKSGSRFNNESLGKRVWVDSMALEGKIKEKEEVKAAGGSMRSGGGYDWREQDKKEFRETEFPRLRYISELCSSDNINNAEAIAFNYIKSRLALENDRDLLSLAALMGLHSADIDPEQLYTLGDDAKWEEKILVIDRIVDDLKGKGFPVMITVLALLNDLAGTDDIRTEQQFELEEEVSFNWAEMVELIEGKKNKKSPKTKTNKK